MARREAKGVPVKDRVPAGRDAKGKHAQDRDRDRDRVAVVEPQQVRPQTPPQPKVCAYAPSADTRNPMSAGSRVCKRNAPSVAAL
jgi:hypothetical protein